MNRNAKTFAVRAPRRLLVAALWTAALATVPSLAAGPASTPFDGAWNVTLSCPPLHDDDDDAKGYTHHFPAQVTDGNIRGVHGSAGEPGWHLLTGSIRPDGKALLQLEGIVSNAAYAVNDAPRGKGYSYRVRASFEAASGTGHRVGRRKCDFTFQRNG